MANLGIVLKDEISRLARKAIKQETIKLQKASAQHRHDIASLKRTLSKLESGLAQLEKRKPASRTSTEKDSAPSVRFNIKGLRSQRKKLGLSAADYAKLVGVTPLSIYNWERGITRPRATQLATLASLRGLGKKEALSRVGKTKTKSKRLPRKKAAAPKKAAPKPAAPTPES